MDDPCLFITTVEVQPNQPSFFVLKQNWQWFGGGYLYLAGLSSINYILQCFPLIFFLVPRLLYERHLSSLMPWVTWYSFLGGLSYLPGSLFLGYCPRVCILVTSSFHLPISSASPGSLNRDSQRNFPFGAGITFFSCYTL